MLKTLKFIKSPNFIAVNQRDISFIVLHHTEMKDAASAISRLCDPESKVSCHYVIDKTNGETTQLVEDKNIAYHAGVSFWRGIERLNAHSIGIELDNDGAEEFTDVQISSLLALLSDLQEKYKIPTANIIGHLDIAPIRKVDPHHKFPWELLAQEGFGLYPKVQSNDFSPSETDPTENFKEFGYETNDLQSVIQAFNIHYNPGSYEHNAVNLWTKSSNILLTDLIEQLHDQDTIWL